MRSKCTNIQHYLDNAQLYGKKCDRKILRTFLLSKNREYKCSLKRQIDGDIIYDGNIYLSNYRYCFAGCFYGNQPHFTKTNIRRLKEQHSKWRIKDSIVYQSPAIELNDCIGLERGYYSESLFLLTSTSSLIRYRITQDTFIEAEYIYLGNKYKFEHLSYDRIFDRLILKSKSLSGVVAQSLSGVPDVVYYFAIFNAAPLKFIGILPVSKTKFGKVINSFIFNGMLTILSSPKIYSLYNIEYILENFLTEYRVGDILGIQETADLYNIENSRAVIGDYPYGLPVNIDMDREPHDNYHVYSCCAENLDFGGFPWQCLLSYNKNGSDSCIYDVSSGSLLASVRDVSVGNHMNEKLVFHADNSGRLLKTNHDSVVCYEIAEHHPNDPDDNLNVRFQISYSKVQSTPRRAYSRFGRQITQCHHSGYTDLKSEIIHSMDYDEELDVIVVLYTNRAGEVADMNGACAGGSLDDVYKVGIYDNQTGEVIRAITLLEEVSEDDDHEWTIYYTDLLLICVLKSVGCKGKTICYMYQLLEDH